MPDLLPVMKFLLGLTQPRKQSLAFLLFDRVGNLVGQKVRLNDVGGRRQDVGDEIFP